MKNSYNSRFLQTYLHQHIELQDTVPDLIQIPNSSSSHYPQHQSYSPHFSRKQWNQQSISSQIKIPYRQHDTEEYERVEKMEGVLMRRVEELQVRLQEKVKRIKELSEKQDQNDRVIEKVMEKNKELGKRLKALQETNNQLEQRNDKMEEELTNIRLKDNFKNINQLQIKRSSTKYSFDKFSKGENKKQIYDKLQQYLKKIVDEFVVNMKGYKLAENVQSKIEEFLVELLAINSFTVDKIVNKNMATSRAPSESRPYSIIATPQRGISPKTTNRSFIYKEIENEGISAKKSESFYVPFTERNERSKSWRKDRSHDGSDTKRNKSQRRNKIFG